MESNKEKIVYKGISRHVETLYISDSFNDCSKKIDMIVKIENLEQEKYVLECAENDGQRIGSSLTGIRTFEQFKAQREEPIKTDLEKENEELKKKLEKIEEYVRCERRRLKSHKTLSEHGEGMKSIVTRMIKIFFQTPSQTEANEIIKNASDEVLEELKKLL